MFTGKSQRKTLWEEVPVGFEPTIYNSFAGCAVCPLRHGTSVGWEGFEPPKPVVPNLQSGCFNRSCIPTRLIVSEKPKSVGREA